MLRLSSRALLVAYAIVLTALAVHASIKGPQLRAEFDMEAARQIEDENRQLCQEFGKPLGTPEFATCANRLGDLRARHKDRILRDLSPIL